MKFLAAFEATLAEVFTTRALFSAMILAVLFYGFYYPAPYRHQGVVDVPVVVVDAENSATTRALVKAIDDTREVAVVAFEPSPAAAERAVRDRRADGIVELGAGLERRLLTGSGGGGIAITVNGAYLLRARAIGVAVEQALRDLVRERVGPVARATGVASPIDIEVRPLFNTTTGYADYVFPAVSVLILQQTLMFGAAMLAGRRRERGEGRADLPEFGGMLAALTLIGCVGCLFYFGLVFWIEDMPRGGNVGGMLAMVPVFSLSVAALGLLIGSFLDSGDRAMELLVPTSVVLFFLTGAAWPTAMMPGWVAGIAMLSPASHGVRLFVGLNQMGASLGEVAVPALRLALLATIYATAAAWRFRRAGATAA